MANAAIVVQNFCKIDTLDALCQSLLKCNGRRDFDLIFWSDSASGSRKEAEYQSKSTEVKKLLSSFCWRFGDQFRSVSMRANTVNRGTCKTCEIALDSAFEDHDFVIFSEDDTVFSPDALEWFLSIGQSPAFLDDTIWAIAGESIFFDGQGVFPGERLVKAARVYATKQRLWEQYIPFNFVPSTCFATNRQKWAQFSATRGQPNGDVDLCDRCRTEGKKSLFPVVSRVKDVGMLHPDGYSVMIHSKENVSSVKSCYLMSGDIMPDCDVRPALRPFDDDAGKLFWRSTRLNGFDDLDQIHPDDQSLGPADRPPSIEAARQAGLDSNWDMALKLWRELKDAGITTIEVDTGIGLCHLKRGDLAQARAAIQEALKAGADDAFAQSIMAHIFEADRNFAEALDIWSKLGQRKDLPEWLQSNALDGGLRCNSAIAQSKC